eukprot:6195965-Pleurochrysis_carterae.AAC.2
MEKSRFKCRRCTWNQNLSHRMGKASLALRSIGGQLTSPEMDLVAPKGVPTQREPSASTSSPFGLSMACSHACTAQKKWRTRTKHARKVNDAQVRSEGALGRSCRARRAR